MGWRHIAYREGDREHYCAVSNFFYATEHDRTTAVGVFRGMRRLFATGYHAIGTCTMGPNDDDVVDPRLRVRGVAALRVVDASVLPIMVSGNLNGPVSALP